MTVEDGESGALELAIRHLREGNVLSAVEVLGLRQVGWASGKDPDAEFYDDRPIIGLDQTFFSAYPMRPVYVMDPVNGGPT